MLPEPAAAEFYALVLRRGDIGLIRQLDDALAAMEEDGTIDALRRRFGLERPDDWPVTPPREASP